MGIFCKNKQGYNTKDFKWHILSGGGYPSIFGEKAHKEYESQQAAEYVVMSNEHEQAIFTDIKTECCTLSDYYVFQLTWHGLWLLPMKTVGLVHTFLFTKPLNHLTRKTKSF